jgi:hypothetical protein
MIERFILRSIFYAIAIPCGLVILLAMVHPGLSLMDCEPHFKYGLIALLGIAATNRPATHEHRRSTR